MRVICKFSLVMCFLFLSFLTTEVVAGLNDGLVAYYPFNGNANDTSGNGHHGVVQGAQLTRDKDGNSASAYLFTGVTNRILVPGFDCTVFSNDFTVTLQAKIDEWAYWYPYLIGGQNYSFVWHLYGPDPNYISDGLYKKFGFYQQNGLDNYSRVAAMSSSQYLTTNVWYQLTVVKEQNNYSMYVDDRLAAEATTAHMCFIDGSSIEIGNCLSSDNNRAFHGTLDEVRIYNRALAYSEIAELADNGEGGGLIAYYPFNGNANDASGNGRNGTLIGPSAIVDRNGNYGSALYFDGVNDYIQVADEECWHLQQFTISVWISPQDFTYGQKTILGKDDFLRGYQMVAQTGIPNEDYSWFGVAKNSTWYTATEHIAFDNSKWYHLVGTYDGSTVKFFVNGTLASTAACAGPINYGTRAIQIGRNGYQPDNPDYYFKGKMDEMRIYNRALSAAEVWTLYGSGQLASGEMTVWVRDGTYNVPMKNAQVIVNGQAYSTDNQGKAVMPVTDGATIRILKDRYLSVERTVSMGEASGGSFTMHETLYIYSAQSSAPVITKVEVLPCGFAIQNENVRIPFVLDVGVDWKQASGGKVIYETSETVKNVERNGTESTTSILLDPLDIFPASHVPFNRPFKLNVYEVQVFAEAAGERSPALEVPVYVLTLPPWLTSLVNSLSGLDPLNPESVKLANKYSMGFNLKLIDLNEDAGKDIDLVVVKIAGEAGLKGKVSLKATASSDSSETSFKASVDGELHGYAKIRAEFPDVMFGSIPITPFGLISSEAGGGYKITWIYPEYMRLDEGYLDFSLKGRIGAIIPLRTAISVVPLVGMPINQGISSFKWVADFIDAFANVEIGVGPNVKAKAAFISENGQLAYNLNEIGMGLGIDAKMNAGNDVLRLVVKGGGEGMFYLVPEETGWDLDRGVGKLSLNIYAEAGFFRLLDFTIAYEVEYKQNGGYEVRVDPDYNNGGGGGFRSATCDSVLIPRDYAEAGYARFMAGRKRGAVSESVFMENVFPNTSSALASVSSNRASAVFVYDNADLAQAQGLEIYYSLYDGNSWSVPAPVVTNMQSELYPDIAVDANNRFVAVWSQVDDADYDAADGFDAFMSGLNVVGSFYDEGAERWSQPVAVLTNDYMDLDPSLACSLTGALAVHWLNNPSNQMPSYLAASNNVASEWLWSRWDAEAKSFGVPQSVVTGLIGITSHELLFSDTNAWAYWTQDIDGLSETTNDSVLCRREWTSSAGWSATEQLTASTNLALNVVATLLPDENPLVVWGQDNTLLYARGANGAAQVCRTNSATAIGNKMSLQVHPDGNRAVLVFVGTTSNSLALTYRVYDLAADRWGDDFVFTATNALDFNLSPAFIGDQLWAMFTRDQMVTTNTTATINDEQVVISNVLQTVRTDLMLAHFSFDADASVSKVGLTTNHPVRIEVTVDNSGDETLSNLLVHVCLGDESGPVLGAVTNSGMLLPHSQVVLSMPWSNSTMADAVTLVAVVDPDDAIHEYSEFNNTATAVVLRTVAELAGAGGSLGASNDYQWVVAINNPLARTLSNLLVSVYRDATNGLLMGQKTVSMLKAFESRDVSMAIDQTKLSDTNTLITTLRIKPGPSEEEDFFTSSTTFYSVPPSVPARVSNLRFLRPGISNQVWVAWDAVTNAGGYSLVSTYDTNINKLVGSTGPVVLRLLDSSAQNGVTQVVYNVFSYNETGPGALSDELVLSSDVTDWDTNGDGLPDNWQSQYFGSEDSPDAGYGADPDDDGFANWQEYLFGTHPLEDVSYPEVGQLRASADSVILAWDGIAQQPYEISVSTNLNDWSVVTNFVSSQDSAEITLFKEIKTNRHEVLFYKISVP